MIPNLNKILKHIVVVLFCLIPMCLFAFSQDEIIAPVSNIKKGIIIAKVLNILANDSVPTSIEVEYYGNRLLLEAKWTAEEIGKIEDYETIEIGKSYTFFIEKTNPQLELSPYYAPAFFPRTYGMTANLLKSNNVFKTYNLLDNKLIPLNKCKITDNFNQKVVPLH